MNPREFCSLPGYTAALFLTYDFDPVFFERVVLRELWAGGTGDIVVVADRSRVDASLDRWGGGVVHLGRRYQLIPAAVEGPFHPKVILRAGPEGVIAWVGSGNLTFGGWGGQPGDERCLDPGGRRFRSCLSARCRHCRDAGRPSRSDE